MKWNFEQEFRLDHPETIGETDHEFDLDNYKDWLEEQLSNARKKVSELERSDTPALNMQSVNGCESVLESAHHNIFEEFHKYRKANFDGTKVSMTGKEMNEIIRLGKIKTKSEHCR